MPAKPAVSSFPLADAMFKAMGEKLDAGERERELFGQLAEKLWTGSWIDPQSGGSMKSPVYAKQRLEALLSKTTEVRRTYQARLVEEGKISDRDFNRSLTDPETSLVHNAWMNDVSAWMNAECLAQYEELLSQESIRGKGKGSAGKPASSAGKQGGKGGKHGDTSARQQAQQLKKQRFNKVINDVCRSKTFFMSFVRHPRMQTLEGFELLLTEIQDFKTTSAYQEMLKQSEKRTEEATRLKRKRDHARFRLKLGWRDAMQHRDTDLAKSFKAGILTAECAGAEAEYKRRKLEGAARSLGNRLHG